MLSDPSTGRDAYQVRWLPYCHAIDDDDLGTRYMSPLSPRLAGVVAALPLRPGMRVIEIGCGPGAAARAVAERLGPGGHVLAVDRSAKAIAQLTESSADLIGAGRLSARCSAVEDLEPDPGEEPFDLAFAIRVGAFDGRFPSAGERGLQRLARMLVPGAGLYIDGGDPLRRIELPVAD